MKLTPRLMMVAQMVVPGRPIADVGTDHAYIPVYLIKNNIIPSAFAGDLRRGPLANAASTVEKFGLESSITLLLSDGLQGFEPNCVKDFVIAGMGGNLIADILGACEWAHMVGNHFVLQPQSHAEVLREYLVNSGYEIKREEIVAEGHHRYIAIEAIYTGKIVKHHVGYYYRGEIPNSSSTYKEEYLKGVEKRLITRLKALEASNPDSPEVGMIREVLTAF